MLRIKCTNVRTLQMCRGEGKVPCFLNIGTSGSGQSLAPFVLLVKEELPVT